MKLVADENIDSPIIVELRKAGYSVLSIAGMFPQAADDQVLRLANHEKAILLTADKDFGELIFRLKQTAYGVILVRLAGLAPEDKSKRILSCLKEYQEELAANFTVISRRSIRIRRQ